MNCRGFEGWLDAGMPDDAAAEARAHAERCGSCVGSWSAAREVEALWSTEPQAPPRFADRVMHAVRSERPRPALAPIWSAGPALPWWTHAAADPAAVLACLLAALVVMRLDWVATLAQVARQASAALQPGTLAARGSALGLDLGRPAFLLAFWMLALPTVTGGSLLLYRWSERLLRRTAGA